MTRFISEDLAKPERVAFLSGNERLDRHFLNTVSQGVKPSYVACDGLIERSTGKVAGFYALLAHSIPLNEFAPELARNCRATPAYSFY